MRSRTMMLVFTLLAPVTVPAYLLFVAGSNLLGGAFYVVIEASLTPLVGRPISLSRMQMALLALPVLVVAPLAAVVHVLLWLVRLVIRTVGWIGRWQVGVERRGLALAFGSVWVLVALWTTVACMNAAAGLGWIGRGISPSSRQRLVESLERDMTLGALPAEMQQRRRAMLKELEKHQSEVATKWQELRAELSDDDFRFRWLESDTIWRRLSGLPWFFTPKEISKDGLDHSILLIGPLMFVWLLLIRWPGMLAVLRYRSLAIACFLVRVFGGGLAIYLLLTWVPRAAHAGFSGYYFGPPSAPSALFRFMSPAIWFGATFGRWARPEWYLLNAGLWMIFAGLAVAVWWVAWRISPFLGWPRYYVAFMASRLLQRKRIAFFSVAAVTLCVAMMIIVISVMGGFVDNIRERAHGLLGDLVVSGNLQGFPYYEEFIAEISHLVDEKTGLPVVEQATPLIHSYGIMQFPETKNTKAVRIWGIRLDEYVKVNEFGKDLFYQNRFGGTRLDVPLGQPVYGRSGAGNIVLPGDMDARFQEYLASLPKEERDEAQRKYRRDEGFYPGPGVFAPAGPPDFKAGYEGKPYPGVIIGRDVLFRRKPSGEYGRGMRYPRGAPCFITVLPLTRTGDVSPEPPPKPLFRYVDDSRTGIHEIDSLNVYVDFQRLQELLSMGAQERADGSGMTSPRCSQIQIKLNDAFEWPREVLLGKKKLIEEAWRKVASEVPADDVEAQMLDGVSMQTWEEMQQSYIAAIEKEKFLVLIMFGVISIVAVLLILCIFYMIVQEKTRDVGILKSLGASTEGVTAVFLVYGGAIGLVGCVLGSLLGTNFVEHINEVQEWLARLNPDWRVWSPDTYSFDKIPSVWKWAEVLWICALSIVASVAGAIIPAIRAGRTWPVQSLRYE